MIEFELKEGSGPLLVTAIHDGHSIRPQLLPHFLLTDGERLREEDPFTGSLTNISSQSLVVKTSRFETDLNRSPDKAIYINPEDAWGLELYKTSLSKELIDTSRRNYEEFYIGLKVYIDKILEREPWLIVYDLHSYNHRRDGVDRFANPRENPEINIGTGNTHPEWQPVVDVLIDRLSKFNFQGRHLDVRENIKFQGGYFSKWLSENFGERICPIAIEFKKFFMDEWTGKEDQAQLQAIRQMLISTIDPVLKSAMKSKRT